VSVDYAEVIRLARKGRRAEQRGKAWEGCITGLITNAINVFMSGLYLMLAVGVVHAHWIHQLPTLGYWRSVLLVFLLKGVFSLAPATKDKS
jgi:hypothetical protein